MFCPGKVEEKEQGHLPQGRKEQVMVRVNDRNKYWDQRAVWVRARDISQDNEAEIV